MLIQWQRSDHLKNFDDDIIGICAGMLNLVLSY